MSLFNFGNEEDVSYSTPQELFDSNKNRKIKSLYDYQSSIIDKYMKNIEEKDVVLELPTGSGKTLVGMLIGDYLRSERNYKVLYLCPTNQLVYQVSLLASYEYGINATAFVGPKNNYTLEDKNNYEFSRSIAVSSYSSFFNSNPYFYDPDVIIFDDSHSANDLISSNWSVKISRCTHNELYNSLIELSREYISEYIYDLCVDDIGLGMKDVDKIPNISFLNIKSVFKEMIEDYINKNKDDYDKLDFMFAWGQIKDNLSACNTFITTDHILIKPFISPTKIFTPFINAKQRIYMSATIGKSGELERTFGIRKPIKIYDEKFQTLTMGRKFFLFPALLFEKEEIKDFIDNLIDYVPRSLMMVKDKKREKIFIEYFESKGKKTYNAQDLETLKEEFVKQDGAVAVISNRPDGINFPNDECRLLILTELQDNTDAQEFFISYRMGSSVLFSELMKIKMMQAVGRCTREYTDYAIVCIVGEKFSRYVLESKNLDSFIPELHAELNFSKQQFLGNPKKSVEEIMSMIKIFLDDREKWDEVERYIQNEAKKIASKVSIDSDINKILEKSAQHEVEFHNCLWIENYEEAIVEADNIIELLCKDEQLKGYLGFWYYLSAYAYFCNGNKTKANVQLKKASENTLSVKWFTKLIETSSNEEPEEIVNIVSNIENKIVDELLKTDKNSILRELDNIKSSITQGGHIFEDALTNLGTWLGYKTYNYEDTGSPDPIWIINSNTCIVTESKIYKGDPEIILRHIRETSTHEQYIKNNKQKLELLSDSDIIVVFISNANTFKDKKTKELTPDIYYVSQERLILWSNQAILVLKEIIKAFSGSQDYLWQEKTTKMLKDSNLTPNNIKNFFTQEKIRTLDY